MSFINLGIYCRIFPYSAGFIRTTLKTHIILKLYIELRNDTVYSYSMIVSFQHKGLRKFYETGSKQGIVASHEMRLQMILAALEIAETAEELNLPAFSLHPLKGNLQSYWSIKVSGNWRVIFRFNGNDVELLDYLDYH